MGNIDLHQLRKVAESLGEAVADPARWPVFLEQITSAVGATGAALLRNSPPPDIPRTASMDEGFRSYFANGWHLRDPRQRSMLPISRGEVATDQDLVTPEEMQRGAYYNEAVRPFGVQWFAGVGCWAGPDLWCLSIHRSPRQGPFEDEEKRILQHFSARLSETATLSQAVGLKAIVSLTNALDHVGQPALAIDSLGRVLGTNRLSDRHLDEWIQIRQSRLVFKDGRTNVQFGALMDRLRRTRDGTALGTSPIIVHRGAARPLVMRALPLDGPARSPFVGARALLLFTEVRPLDMAELKLAAEAFGLTLTEARIAARLSTGESIDMIAAAMGIARETGRRHLKSVFLKTDTHRQGELVALLASLPRIEVAD